MGGWCALLCNCLRSSYPPLHSWPLSHIQCLPACILCLCGGRYGKIVDVELQWESAAEFQAGAAAALGMPGACAAVCNAWPRLAWPPSLHSKHRAPSSLLPTGGAPSCLACLLLQWGLMMFSPGGGCKGSLLKALNSTVSDGPPLPLPPPQPVQATSPPPTAAPTALLLQVVPELTGALKLMLQYRTT